MAQPYTDLLMKLSAEEIDEILFNPQTFAETMLIEPDSKEPFKANYVQQAMFKAYNDDHQKICLRVSRRTGKTFGMTIIMLWSAFVFERFTVMVVAPDKAKINAIFKVIDSFLNVNPWFGESRTRRTESPYTLREFSNGSSIVGFTTGTKGGGEASAIRGQRADLIVIDEADFLGDKDWPAINPIINGDRHHEPPRALMASTPKRSEGYYYQVSQVSEDAEDNTGWYPIHISINDNPDFEPEERVTLRKSCKDLAEWQMEYLAEPPTVGAGVWRVTDLDRAKCGAWEYSLNQRRGGEFSIGVDWDKYQAGCTIAVVEYLRELEVYNLVYWAETERTDFTYVDTVEEIIRINEILDPVAINVDRGSGETQVELLRARGVAHSSTGLDKKVHGFHFHQKIEVKDPVSGQLERMRFKDATIGFTTHLLEQGRFRYPAHDNKLDRMFKAYHVVRNNPAGPVYSSDNEHAIDAIGLALWGFHSGDRETKAITISRDNFKAQILEFEHRDGAGIKLIDNKPNPIRSFSNESSDNDHFTQERWGSKPMPRSFSRGR